MSDVPNFEHLRRRFTPSPPSGMPAMVPSPPPMVPSDILSPQSIFEQASAPAKSVGCLQELEKAILDWDRLVVQRDPLPANYARLFALVRSTLVPVFGAKSNLVLKITEWTKDCAKKPLDKTVLGAHVAEIRHFTSLLRTCSERDSLSPVSAPSPYPKTRSVFIIHGHDENNWLKLDRMLRTEFNLDPIVILARPGQSLPTIQKFENDASKCAYAIAMFTPDDTVENAKSGKCSQARPNVIFETGWFIGRLGKDRVLLLVKDGTQLHSDFAGMNRIEFHDDVTHKFLEIKRELEASDMISS